jgi:hypothetical protein
MAKRIRVVLALSGMALIGALALPGVLGLSTGGTGGHGPANLNAESTSEPPLPPTGDGQRPIKVINNPGPGMRARGFVMGVVTARDGDTLSVHDQSTDEVFIVRVAAGANVVRGWPVTADQIEVGDRVDATGDVQPDGAILARIVDVNTVQVRGPVIDVTPDGSWVVEERAGSAGAIITGRLRRVVFDPTHPPVGPEGRPVALEGLRPRSPDRGVIIIGMSLPDGSVLATNLVFY